MSAHDGQALWDRQGKQLSNLLLALPLMSPALLHTNRAVSSSHKVFSGALRDGSAFSHDRTRPIIWVVR